MSRMLRWWTRSSRCPPSRTGPRTSRMAPVSMPWRTQHRSPSRSGPRRCGPIGTTRTACSAWCSRPSTLTKAAPAPAPSFESRSLAGCCRKVCGRASTRAPSQIGRRSTRTATRRPICRSGWRSFARCRTRWRWINRPSKRSWWRSSKRRGQRRRSSSTCVRCGCSGIATTRSTKSAKENAPRRRLLSPRWGRSSTRSCLRRMARPYTWRRSCLRSGPSANAEASLPSSARAAGGSCPSAARMAGFTRRARSATSARSTTS